MKYIITIEEGANGRAFQKGLDYYNEGNVIIEKVNSLGNLIKFEAKVEGSGRSGYQVKLAISKETEDVHSYSCNCPAFSSYEGPCKHIVATTFEAEDIIEVLLKNKDEIILRSSGEVDDYFTDVIVEKNFLDFEPEVNENYRDILDEALEEYEKNSSSFLDRLRREKEQEEEKIFIEQLEKFEIKNIKIKEENKLKEKKRLNIEFEIKEEDSYHRTNNMILRLKAGEEKLYYITNIEEFCTAIFKRERYEISKKITYNSDDYFFSEADYNILKTIYDYIVLLNNFGIYYSKLTKGISISPIFLDIILDKIEENRSFEYNGRLCKKIDKKEPIFILENGRISFRKIYRISRDSLYFVFLFDESVIYKMIEAEKELLDELKGIEEGYIEKLPLELNNKLKVILENKEINIAKVTKDLGRIEIFADKVMDAKDVIALKIMPEDRSREKDGKYYIFQKNISILEKIGEFFLINKQKLKKVPIIMGRISYDKFLDFSQFLEENIDEKDLKLYIDKNIKQVKKININFDVKYKNSNLLNFTFDIDGLDLSDADFVLKELKKSKKYITLTSGELVKIINKNFDEIINVINFSSNLKIGTNKISKLKALQLSQVSDNIKNNLNEIEEFKDIFNALKSTSDEEAKNIKVELFSYQKIGYNWLKKIYKLGLGGILSDDMGLGKTIQMISLIADLEKTEKDFKALIVVPTSLIYNWKNEFEKFSYINPIVVDGLKNNRIETILNFKKGILITTYQTLRNDIENYENIDFNLAVLDEAQNIKNVTSQVKRAVMKIKSKVNFALTGTPIENNILELWSIFDFILTGYLDNISNFKKVYKETFGEISSNKMLSLKRMIAPFILRRTKKEVLIELPDKIENNMLISLSDEQKKLYASYVKQAKSEIATLDKTENNRIKILAMLTKLRQICNSPALFNENYSGEAAKLEVLKGLLPEIIENNHRFLIFSQFVGTLKEIGEELRQQNIEYFYIDGSTKSKDRIDISKRFNAGEKSGVLISLKAGGTGLNLIGADIVIHYDPWWNIAVEDQASDRAHRIGQKNSVQIIKLISKGTIEEEIIKIQEAKRKLSKGLLDKEDGEKTLFEMTDQELMDLIS